MDDDNHGADPARTGRRSPHTAGERVTVDATDLLLGWAAALRPHCDRQLGRQATGATGAVGAGR